MAGNPPRTAYTPTPAQNAFFGRAAGGSGGGGAINPFFGAPSAALQQVQAAALPSPTSALPAAAATPVLPLATPFNPRDVEYRQGLGQGVADARERLEDTQERRGFAEDPNALSLMQQRLQLTQQLGAETARLSRMELAAKASTLDSPEHLSQLREEIALQKEQTQYEEKLSQLRRNLGAGNQPTLMQRVQRALPALQGVGATASALGQLAQTPTSAMGTPGEALSRAGGALGNIGQALTPFLPVAGGVVSALGSVVGGLGALAKAFQDVKPSLAELTGEMERAQGIRSRIAREGAPSGEDIRRTFGPTVARDIERLQNQGQGGQALGIVRGQTAEARQEVSQLERGNLGELRSEVEAELFRQLDRYRSGATNGTFTTAAGTAQANLQGR